MMRRFLWDGGGAFFIADAFTRHAPAPKHEHDWEGCPGSDTDLPTLEKRKKVRCPECKRRLLPYAVHCVGGEFVCWKLPRHKPKGKS